MPICPLQHCMQTKRYRPCLLNGIVQLVDQANTFALSFSLARISSDCDILLRRPDVSIPQTENTCSTYACEADAATKSNAVSARQSYVAKRSVQYVTVSGC